MILLRANKIIINIIVPKKPVTADKGISAPVKLLENISVTTIKDAPKTIVSGMVRCVFLPTNSLTICGTTKPIQLIVPEKATELAVSKVAINIITMR